jgi:phage-related protein
MSSQNPFQAPSDFAPLAGTASATQADLRGIAKNQRTIMLCLLFNISMYIFGMLVPRIGTVCGSAALICGVVASVFIFMLATKLYGLGLGIFMAILTLIPCLGLIALLIVNGKATNVLKGQGIRVGLLGANPSEIP